MLSRITYIVSVLLMFAASFWLYPRWKQPRTEATISWDVSGYYWYLPSLFIYKDIAGQSFKDSILAKYAPTNNDFQQGLLMDNGGYVMKYASGMALMYLPFFTAAHLLAGPLGYPPDGFSAPYQFAIQLGGFLVAILGLWYLRRLLLLYYDDRVVAVTLLMLVVGSNYLNYAAIDCGMSHSWLFTVYVLLLLNTHHFYREFRLRYAVRIGLLVGLATLTRPTDIISCLIPLLWGMEGISLRAIGGRLRLFAAQYKPLLAAAACAAPVVFIQLIYWKYVSGHWMVYSYGGQEFSWTTPHFSDYTFSYRSGWLVYSPMMAFAFIGLLPLWRNGRNRLAITVFFLLNYYIVSSWDIWWYGGRAMVQSYPVLVFPMASLVAWVLQRRLLAWGFYGVVVVLCYYNLWITVQYHMGGLFDSQSMNAPYFWRVVGRWSVPENTIFLRDKAELYHGAPKEKKLIYQRSFDADTGDAYAAYGAPAKRYLRLDKDHQVSPSFTFAYSNQNAGWLRARALFVTNEKEWDVWKMTQFIVTLKKNDGTGSRVVKENMLRALRVMDRKSAREIELDIKLPHEEIDSVTVWFHNADSPEDIYITDIKVWQMQ